MNNNATKFWGIVLFVVGIVFLLSNYAVIPETVSRIWPIVLLVFGLKLFFTKKEQVSRA
jgi:membrane-bound ClpP family serine protease